MKGTKPVSLLFVSLLLLMLAAWVLLYTWGYYKFYKNKPEHETQLAVNTKNSVDDYRDSLQKIYSATINNINTNMNSTSDNVDTINLTPDLSSAGFYKLKT